MPASLFPEMERSSSGGLEDQRALQLALELSMLGLNNENDSLHPNLEADTRNKKSQNTTECVPVPSSEHVAEIVGRQGCKIKALRAKTNTYIKTPVRGEEPVFVVTGRKEDVAAAKREILSAAEHFSQIRAQRKNHLNGSLAPGPNSNIPGQTTLQVRVPYRVVGLVVGPKGATIKRIQQQTNTYIVTPSRDKEPVFEVTGLPESVEAAKREIEAHIAMRTGGALGEEEQPPSSEFTSSSSEVFGFPPKLYFAYESDEGLGDSPTFDPAGGLPWEGGPARGPPQRRGQRGELPDRLPRLGPQAGQARLRGVLRERGGGCPGALRPQYVLHGVRQPGVRQARAPVPRVQPAVRARHAHLLLGHPPPSLLLRVKNILIVPLPLFLRVCHPHSVSPSSHRVL
ncbi:hypothetical protein HPB48_006710 [Haemaphysalis longicornis]|uniref:K Homology domain-containing protein n=1 Tax=Haemaphysalis longicornis TaxID=44386 RepID=A0A9J6G7E9_HAELO|nr:hypothetical protein HPB48_006710 [Haemaphysalis longicornis]